MTDAQESRLQSITSQVGEFFDEYLLICKPDKHKMVVCSSDSTWAIGAAQRFVTLADADDRVDR